MKPFWGLLDESGNELRFGRGTVGIADISQQFYCEKQLELDYVRQLEPSEEMILGQGPLLRTLSP